MDPRLGGKDDLLHASESELAPTALGRVGKFERPLPPQLRTIAVWGNLLEWLQRTSGERLLPSS
jgi:hypothetical protein